MEHSSRKSHVTDETTTGVDIIQCKERIWDEGKQNTCLKILFCLLSLSVSLRVSPRAYPHGA